MEPRIGLDTNILLRFAHIDHPESASIRAVIRRFRDADTEFCFTPQIVGEFWNVSTRPIDRNGFGLSPRDTLDKLNQIEKTMTLLPDDVRVYKIWRRLLINHEIKGIQVHDAHLAASLEAHNVTQLLTLNSADFKRFSQLMVLHPKEI